MTQPDHTEDDVLRRMLNTPSKPREKPPETEAPRRRGRPIGGGGPQ
jgi:hypothetical protein